ncbi:hypothetical protein TNCV_1953961 [Trichonephila clavipes]|nr:hypothetical protein TNCV_1953961 [Trichonephila clavipes]
MPIPLGYRGHAFPMGVKYMTGWVSLSGTVGSNLKSKTQTGAKILDLNPRPTPQRVAASRWTGELVTQRPLTTAVLAAPLQPDRQRQGTARRPLALSRPAISP